MNLKLNIVAHIFRTKMAVDYMLQCLTEHQDGSQAAVGDPVVSQPVEPLPKHRADDTEHLHKSL